MRAAPSQEPQMHDALIFAAIAIGTLLTVFGLVWLMDKTGPWNHG